MRDKNGYPLEGIDVVPISPEVNKIVEFIARSQLT